MVTRREIILGRLEEVIANLELAKKNLYHIRKALEKQVEE